MKYVRCAIVALVFAFVLMPVVAALAETVTPQPSAAAAWETFLSTLIGGATAALVFVGGLAWTLRPVIAAKAAQLVASVSWDKREVFEKAVSAGLELHPNDYGMASDYVRSTIPDTLRDLGINLGQLPHIVEARKLALNRERQDKVKQPA